MNRLRQRLTQAASDSERMKLDLALADILVERGQPSEALPHGRRALTITPTSDAAFVLVCRALVESGRTDECRSVIAERFQRSPDDPAALRMRVQVENYDGRHEEAERAGRRLIALAKADAADWNRLAWAALFRPPVTEQAVQDSQRSIQMQPAYVNLHTLAMLYAELGKTSEARDVLWHRLDLGGIEQPDSSAWLVVGRIAEALDAREAAMAAYRKVEVPSQPYLVAFSSYALAQKRLAELAKR
ncbi:MAG TPA: tetratricopeptide repeat protein [Candidatus Methylomirabilis sp.]|nr:tetratricopeptide repeat protein [Candidatus Methylomirabilis sp.]